MNFGQPATLLENQTFTGGMINKKIIIIAQIDMPSIVVSPFESLMRSVVSIWIIRLNTEIDVSLTSSSPAREALQ